MAMVVVVTGLPGAGKSTIARCLRDALAWPLLAKDAIKESLFDSLGWSDRAWSKRVSVASYDLMFRCAAELLRVQVNCILEGNFRWSENEHHFAHLTAEHAPTFVQVFCSASQPVLQARLRARATDAAARHPGHVDAASLAELEAELCERPPTPLPLSGPLVRFDSTSPAAPQADIVAQVLRHVRT